MFLSRIKILALPPQFQKRSFKKILDGLETILIFNKIFMEFHQVFLEHLLQIFLQEDFLIFLLDFLIDFSWHFFSYFSRDSYKHTSLIFTWILLLILSEIFAGVLTELAFKNVSTDICRDFFRNFQTFVEICRDFFRGFFKRPCKDFFRIST